MIPFKDELDKLSLSQSEYALFGSAQLAVKGIRPSKDLDIIVTSELWESLTSKYLQYIKHHPIRLHLGNVEIFKDWVNLSDKIDEMIANAEIIDGIPFVRMEYVLEWKRFMGRPKDIADISLIEKHFSRQRRSNAYSKRQSSNST